MASPFCFRSRAHAVRVLSNGITIVRSYVNPELKRKACHLPFTRTCSACVVKLYYYCPIIRESEVKTKGLPRLFRS